MGRFTGRLRLMRAQRRYMPAPATSRTGVAALVLALLIAGILAITVVERRTAGREHAMAEYAAARDSDAIALLRNAFGTRPLMVVGDVAGAPAPKRFAAELIAALARGPGLDYVALEVGSDLQPWIDRYLESDLDDASVLLTHPRTVRQADGVAPDYLAIYRQVREVNREIGTDRRIRVLAIDSPDWPPARATSPTRMVPLMTRRDEHMFDVIERRVFARDERARVLILVDGLRVLRARARLQIGGVTEADAVLLADRLNRSLPGRVVSVLIDAPSGASGSAKLFGYRPARLDRIVRPAAISGTLAFALDPAFPATVDDLGFTTPPGISVRIQPEHALLADVVDYYIRLSN